MWRFSLAAACLLGLAGCNNVVSMEPWFTAADAQGGPRFREGLWLSVSEADCRVEVARPAERWPDCARATFVRGDERLVMAWDDPDGDGGRRRIFTGWEKDPTLFANGDPLIGQLEMQSRPSATPSDATVEEIGADPEEEEFPWRYLYSAIRPTRFDEQGNVAAFESWGVVCGPLRESPATRGGRRRAPASDEYEEAESNVTDQPFPGLTIYGDNCTAESVDALRRAATLSEPLEAHGNARWVRDGWR